MITWTVNFTILVFSQLGLRGILSTETALNLATLLYNDMNDMLLPEFDCMDGCLGDFFKNICYGGSSSHCGQASNRCSMLFGFDLVHLTNYDNCILEFHNPFCSSDFCWGIVSKLPGTECQLEGKLFTCKGGTHCSMSSEQASFEVCSGSINFNLFSSHEKSPQKSLVPSTHLINSTLGNIHPGSILRL